MIKIIDAIRKVGLFFVIGGITYGLILLSDNTIANINGYFVDIFGERVYSVIFEIMYLVFVILFFTLVNKIVRNKPLKELIFYDYSNNHKTINNYFLVISIIYPIVILVVPFITMMILKLVAINGIAQSKSKFYVFYIAMSMLVNVLVEELALRGYILNSIRDSYSSKVAIITSSIIFALLHLGNEINIIAILNIFILGIFLGIITIKSGNLIYAIITHLAWNLLQILILSMPMYETNYPHLLDIKLHGENLLNGGYVGLEGSILVLIMIIAVTLIYIKKILGGMKFVKIK